MAEVGMAEVGASRVGISPSSRTQSSMKVGGGVWGGAAITEQRGKPRKV